MEAGKGGQADDGGKRKPLAGGAGRVYGAQVKGAEGRGAEGFEGIEGGEDGVGVLQDQGSGGDGERSLKGVIQTGDLNLCGAGKRGTGFEEKEELVAEGQIGAGGDLDGRRCS